MGMIKWLNSTIWYVKLPRFRHKNSVETVCYTDLITCCLLLASHIVKLFLLQLKALQNLKLWMPCTSVLQMTLHTDQEQSQCRLYHHDTWPMATPQHKQVLAMPYSANRTAQKLLNSLHFPAGKPASVKLTSSVFNVPAKCTFPHVYVKKGKRQDL